MGNVNEDFPSKGLLVTSNLSVKYCILYKIGVVNWAPSSYRSGITPSLVRLLYHVSISVAFDLGEYAFEKVVKHDKSYVVKILIRFSSLICGSFSGQNNDLITSEEESCATPWVLNFNYNFFARKHVLDIYLPNIPTVDKADTVKYMLGVPPLFGLVRIHILKTLIHEAKALEEIISISTPRK